MLVLILASIMTVHDTNYVLIGDLSRYSNLFPYDSHRVVVKGSPGDSDYVNASWLSVPGVDHKIILAMGPLHPDYHGEVTPPPLHLHPDYH